MSLDTGVPLVLIPSFHHSPRVAPVTSRQNTFHQQNVQNQAMKWAESRATALHGAMAGWGTAEDQLIRVIICASFKDSLSKCVLHLPVAL